MGPLRRGLILSLLPGAAWAEVCSTERPAWDGTPATALSEALTLFSTPAAVLLIVLSALVLRLRSQWGGLIVVVLWTILSTVLTTSDPTGNRQAAILEGCIGSPALFLGLVTAICVGIILYTAPLGQRGKETES